MSTQIQMAGSGTSDNIGNANLTIDVSGVRKLILGGSLSSDKFSIRNSIDTLNYFSVDGSGRIDMAYLGDVSRVAINTTAPGQAAVGIGSGTPGLRTVSIGFNNVAAGQNGVVIGYGNNASNAGSCGIAIGSNNIHKNGVVLGQSNTGELSIVLGDLNAIGGAGPYNNKMTAIGRGMTETSGDIKLPHTFMFGSYATTGNKAGLTYKSNNKNHLLLGYDIMSASYSSEVGDNWMGVKNGTAEPAGAVDAFQFYSKDIVAGNSAPHFRTENGDVLKLYKNTALTAADGTLATAITRQAEIETILTNLGIL